jgi:UDP-glucose:(heptosyl)LPS alpha-1,3-glucosyltransferase
MKLGFLIYSYFPYGGQQRDFLKIAKECVGRGHRVIVYTMKWEGRDMEGLEVRIAPRSSRNRIRLYKLFTAWVSEQLRNEDCDLIVGFNKMPGLDIYFAADPCFEEKALTQRGYYYRYTPRYRHFNAYERAVFGPDSTTRILTLSPLQQRAYAKHFPESVPRMTQLPPGIDQDRRLTDAAADIRRQLRNEFTLGEDDLLVLQVGSGFRVKGVDRSLRALASLPEEVRNRVTYLLIGQDKPGRFLRLAKSLGVSELFKVLPGRDDIPRFMVGADLLLHPAFSESAGYVLLEATIAGLPVLTTSTCGFACHIEKAGSGLVCSEPFSQRELNARLLDMLTSTDRQRWQQNGIQYGREADLFSMAKAAADQIEQYGRIAGQ